MNKLKDNMLLGLFLGLLIPFVSYVLLKFILDLTLEENLLRESTMQVIAIFVNFPVFRNLLTKYKKDRLGRGMLLSTFGLAVWWIVQNDMITL